MSRSRISILLKVVMFSAIAAGPVGWVVEQKQRRIEQMEFADALLSAGAGRWCWDIKHDVLKWDDQMFVLFGRARETWMPNYDGLLACVAAWDRETVRMLVAEAIAKRNSYQQVFTVITDDGKEKLIRASGKVSSSGRFMNGICLPSMQDPQTASPPPP